MSIRIRADKMPSMKAINKRGNASTFIAASTFSGMGGATIGIKMGGVNVCYANEFIPVAADVYDANHTIKCDRKDIRKVKGKDILKACGLQKPGELDLLEGSPPCKVFSAAQIRKQGRDFGQEIDYSEGIKQRVDDLFFEFTRLLRVLQPKTFFAENVPGLTKAINQGYFVEIHKALAECGYHVEAAIVDPSRFGLPQRRERLVFVGVRQDIHNAGIAYKWPKATRPETTVAECLPHIVRIKTTKGYKNSKSPSPTITASDHSIGETANFSCGGFVETADGVQRKYTISELKVISGVPADFKFPKQEKESARKYFQRSWERLGRIHSPLSVYPIVKSIRETVLEPARSQGF